jgi:excisionase family DNA binding protein
MGERFAMDTEQLAEATGLSASTIRRERREGRLRATIVRGRVLYQAEDVKAWLGGAAGQQEVV